MQTCKSSHGEQYAARKSDFRPTRLIDIGPPTMKPEQASPPTNVRLVHTNSLEKYDQMPYVTLSHCWEEGAFATLTTTNLDKFAGEGIPWMEICRNKNFADAVRVAQRLGIRYIWIDSLCIIQEGDGGRDWRDEAPLMYEVCRSALCNIAASDSSNG
jgi:hypothetical protein